MRRQEARDLARSLMDASGLFDWRFRFDHARRRAGACTHATRTISLSGPLTDLYDADTVRAVVLHEIAHALVGPAHGHDAAWRRAARAPRRVSSCGVCSRSFDASRILTWRRHGVAASPGGAYERELASLRARR